MPDRRPDDDIPDVRDGLTRVERCVLRALHELRAGRGGRSVPTAQLYGRVLDDVEISVAELEAVLVRLGARGG